MRNSCHKHLDHVAAELSELSHLQPRDWLERQALSKEPDHSRNPHDTISFFLSGNSLACINRSPRLILLHSHQESGTQRETLQRRLRPGRGTCPWPWATKLPSAQCRTPALVATFSQTIKWMLGRSVRQGHPNNKGDNSEQGQRPLWSRYHVCLGKLDSGAFASYPGPGFC